MLNYKALKTEFFASCLKDFSLENCFLEKFTSYSTKTDSHSDYTDFRDLGALNITQTPQTDPFYFLNNICGGLGFFIDIAFPNLIEFFQFILEIVLVIFKVFLMPRGQGH